MRQMYSPAEFAAEVNRQAEMQQDMLLNTSEIHFASDAAGSKLLATYSDEDGATNDGSWGIKDTAHQQIAQRLHIPIPYYRRMQAEQPSLLDANVMTWFREKPENRLVRTMDGNVRAFLSDRYQRIDNLRILSAIAPILTKLQNDGAVIESCGLTDTKMYVKVIVPSIEAEISPADVGRGGGHVIADVFWPGFVIGNSETGHGAFSVEQLIYKRACKNGLIVGDSIRRTHLGSRLTESNVFSDRTRQLDDETILSAAYDLVEAATDEAKFTALVHSMGETVNTPASVDPVKTCEALAKSYSLTEAERTHVLRAFTMDASDNGYGLFGLVNAVTRASQDVEDYDRATELERLGGTLVNASDREWLKLAGIAA